MTEREQQYVGFILEKILHEGKDTLVGCYCSLCATLRTLWWTIPDGLNKERLK